MKTEPITIADRQTHLIVFWVFTIKICDYFVVVRFYGGLQIFVYKNWVPIDFFNVAFQFYPIFHCTFFNNALSTTKERGFPILEEWNSLFSISTSIFQFLGILFYPFWYSYQEYTFKWVLVSQSTPFHTTNNLLLVTCIVPESNNFTSSESSSV